MSPGIYSIGDDGQLTEMREQPYASEDDLQSLLEEYPELLTDEQPAGERRPLVLVAREAGLASEQDGASRWSVDHLFLDHGAVPTLVEVKRSSDTRIRREVVGKMLDYAANAVLYWPIESLRSSFEETCAGRGSSPEDALASLLGPDADQEAFWLSVKTNLLAGRIRMVFVADEIPPELQRIVEFLNGQMSSAEVLAVELRQFVAAQQRTLVPRLLGQTAAARQAKSAGRQTRRWDEDSFLTDLEERRGGKEAQLAREILAWARATGHRVVFGTGYTQASLSPTIEHSGRRYSAIALWSRGSIELQLHRLQLRPPFDAETKRLELLQRFNQLPGVDLPPEAVTRFPSIPLSVLSEASALQAFLETLEWFRAEVLAS